MIPSMCCAQCHLLLKGSHFRLLRHCENANVLHPIQHREETSEEKRQDNLLNNQNAKCGVERQNTRNTKKRQFPAEQKRTIHIRENVPQILAL